MAHLPANDQEIYRSTYFKASWLKKEEQVAPVVVQKEPEESEAEEEEFKDA